jgi:uncharacterized protein (TIGR03067 family)
MPAEMVKSGKRVLKDGELTVTFDGKVYFKAKITIDPRKKVKTMDYEMTEGTTKGKKHLGIYEIDGDTVKFCFAQPDGERPTSFEAKEGSKNVLSTWKRVKKDK